MMIQRLPCRTDHQPKVAISDRICRLRHRSRWTATSGCRDSLLPTPESDVVYWDAGCPGFGVKITPKGRGVAWIDASQALRWGQPVFTGEAFLPIPNSKGSAIFA